MFISRTRIFVHNFIKDSRRNKKLMSSLSKVVVLDGYRTPFCLSGTSYLDYQPMFLVSTVVEALLSKLNFSPSDIQYCILGNAIQNFEVINMAKDSLNVLPKLRHIPAHNVAAACVSSLLATTSAFESISLGKYNAVLAGGFDYASDVPFRCSKENSTAYLASKKNLTASEYYYLYLTKILKAPGMKFPEIKEFTTNRTMIDECEIMCRMNDISREDADKYALLSYERAEKAYKDNLITDVCDMILHDEQVIKVDNNIGRANEEKMKSLKPISDVDSFIKSPFSEGKKSCRSYSGSVTAANSTSMTDGASMSLITSESFSQKLGYKPLAYIKDFIIEAHDPYSQSLLGPAYSIPKLLVKHDLKYNDISVFEIHEAFAGQILSVLKALNDSSFLSNTLNISKPMGTITIEDINKLGGSIAFGHPFGATGTRLINMACKQLDSNGGRYAIVSSCSMSGQSVSILLERYTNK